MSEPIDIKLAKIEQLVTDGFQSTDSKLRDIIVRNKDHDDEDDKRFSEINFNMNNQSQKISDLDKKVVYATGIVIGAGFALKFLLH